MAVFGNLRKQQEMSNALRDAGARLVRRGPRDALGYIVIGVPADGAPRLVHNLRDLEGAYLLMEQLVKDWKGKSRVRPGSPPADG